MKTIITGLLVLNFATVTHGGKCCVPRQWQGYWYGAGNLFRPKSFEAERAYYDADIRKFAISGVFVHNGNKVEVKMIEDYNTSTGYFIKPASEECTRIPVGRVFPEICVPDDAHEIGKSYIGFGENKLNVKGYRFRFNESLFVSEIFMVVTETNIGCIPISVDERGTNNGKTYFETVNYLEMNNNITDTTVFDIPGYCYGKIPGETYERIHRKYAIFNF